MAKLTLRQKISFTIWVTVWFTTAFAKAMMNKFALENGISPLTALVTQLVLQACTTLLIVFIAGAVFGKDLRAMFKLKVSSQQQADISIDNQGYPPSKLHRDPSGELAPLSPRDDPTSSQTPTPIPTDDENAAPASTSLDALSPTLFHQSSSIAFTTPSATLPPRVAPPPDLSLLQLIPFTTVHVGAHLAAQVSLSLLPVWALKLAKATGPLWAALFASIVLREPLSLPMAAALMILCVAAAVTAMGAGVWTMSLHTLSLIGLLLGLCSSALYAAEKVCAKHLYTKGADPYRLLITSNLIGAAALAPIAIGLMLHSPPEWPSNNVILALLGNGCIDSILGISMLLALQIVGATAHQVTQAGERMFVLLLALAVTGGSVDAVQAGGLVGVCVGILGYAWAKTEHDKRKAKLLSAAAAEDAVDSGLEHHDLSSINHLGDGTGTGSGISLGGAVGTGPSAGSVASANVNASVNASVNRCAADVDVEAGRMDGWSDVPAAKVAA